MYLLIDSQSNQIICSAAISKDSTFTLADVFPEATKEQVLAWFEGEQLPDHFEVNSQGDLIPFTIEQQVEQGLLDLENNSEIAEGKIVQKSIEKQVKEGLIKIKPNQKIYDNLIVEKTLLEQIDEGLLTLAKPYQYIENNEIKHWTIEQVLKQDIVCSLEEALILKTDLQRQVEKAIAAKYSPGLELKLIKDFSAWVAEGSPEKDERQSDFQKMQNEIEAIKQSFSTQKSQIKALIEALS